MEFNYFFRRFYQNHSNSDVGFKDPFDTSIDMDENGGRGDSFEQTFQNPEDFSVGIFEQMEDMFSKMLSASFGPLALPKFEAPHESNPRSIMLRKPDADKWDYSPSEKLFEEGEPVNLVDSDIDDKVAKQGLFPLNFQEKEKPYSFSYKKFSSVRRVHLSDGTIEEHRTVSDGEGNMVAKVRRSIGDQSHEVITHSDNHGLKEKEEKFINIDENDIPKFEERWNLIKSEKRSKEGISAAEHLSESMMPRLAQSSGDPMYLSLFKRFFGSLHQK